MQCRVKFWHEDVATLMDLREALATVVTAEDETPLRGALDALWASDLPPTTMIHVRRIQTGNVAGLGEGKRASCEGRRARSTPSLVHSKESGSHI